MNAASDSEAGRTPDPRPRRHAGGVDPASQVVVSERIEAALRELLSEEVARLTGEGKGGPKCWPAVLLGAAAKRSHAANPKPHPVARTLRQALDLRRPIPQELRAAAVAFCRGVVRAPLLGLGSLHHARRVVTPYLQEMLAPLGDERAVPEAGSSGGRHLTIQQLMLRLGPKQPVDVQALAVKVLPEIVAHELRFAPTAVNERQKALETLDQAVGMVRGTKYFESLAPKMRKTCDSRMTQLQQRIERAGRR